MWWKGLDISYINGQGEDLSSFYGVWIIILLLLLLFFFCKQDTKGIKENKGHVLM
jgi:hypothetical protein